MYLKRRSRGDDSFNIWLINVLGENKDDVDQPVHHLSPALVC